LNLRILIIDPVDFFHNILLLILYKILIIIYKIINYNLNFFSYKSNHNKQYYNF
jgi:hypothetical protein